MVYESKHHQGIKDPMVVLKILIISDIHTMPFHMHKAFIFIASFHPHDLDYFTAMRKLKVRK